MDDGIVGVKVTRNTMEFKEGYIFSITFSGINVKGNIPEIELGSQGTYYLGGSPTTDEIKVAIATHKDGYEPSIALKYDNQISECINIYDINIGRHSLQNQMQSFVHNMIIRGKLSKVNLATKTKIANLQSSLNIIFDFENIVEAQSTIEDGNEYLRSRYRVPNTI